MNWLHAYGIRACEEKALELAEGIRGRVVNLGGGDDDRWPDSITIDARFQKGLDFNTSELDLDCSTVDLVVCEQVIEHLHNTTWFLSELRRILRPKGVLLLSTENLVSLPNLFAMILQLAPFSTQHMCSRYVGGWKSELEPHDISINDPTFSGRYGHVRVMTVGQIKALLRDAGFENIRKYGYAGNHYVLFHATRK